MKLWVGMVLALLALARTLPAAADPGASERADAAAAVTAARRHDWHTAIALVNTWAGEHPEDLDFRTFLPVYYRLAGDLAGWQQARDGLIAAHAKLPDNVAPHARPAFVIDGFQEGANTILVEQCYDRAGRFAVLYKFNVLDTASHRLTSFFTVESSDADNAAAQAFGQVLPVTTLDHFTPGLHETVASLRGPVDYDEVRRLVVHYFEHPSMISSSTQPPGLSREGCEFAKRPG